MSRPAAALIGILFIALPLLAKSEVSPDETWQTYVDSTYKVTMRFPGDWKKNPLYRDRPFFSVEWRQGSVPRGFFQLSAMEAENATPEQQCKELAEQVVRHGGAHPTIRPLKVQGQSACLVSPFGEPSSPLQAEVIIQYPEPVEIEGDLWNLLVLNADKDYILAITQTLRFITATQQNAPFSIEVTPQNPADPGTASWKLGTPVTLILTLKNNSERELQFMLSSPFSDYRMTVLDSRHERVPVGDEFVRMEEDLKLGRAPTRKKVVSIRPQQTYQDSIEVSDWYDLNWPGRYTVQIERDLPPELGKGIVRSNTLNVTVIH